MKRKGISLIVLIITCVVIIIIATAIIVNIAQTNMIENAKEAVVKQDFKTMQDELLMYKADKYVEEKGNFKAEDLNVEDKTKIAEIIPSIVGTKYEEYILIEDGKIAISDTMPEKERKWAMEALGLVKTSTNRPTEPVIPTTPNGDEIVFDNIKGTANVTIDGKDFAYNNPVVPVGFMAINTADAKWSDENGWNNGLVIEDKLGNQFVWVPVDGINVKYAKWCTYGSSYTSTSDAIDALPIVNESVINEKTQIEKYYGFYIGRYESGVPANQTIIDGTNNETSNVTGKPVIQKKCTVWTNIDYTNANINALDLYKTDNVRSGLVTGTQWDTVCAWIQNEKDLELNILHSVTDSRTWKNSANSTSPANVTGYGSKQVTGYSEYWKAKNIYDFAGNTWEWSGEMSGGGYSNRGGGIVNKTSNDSAASRTAFKSWYTNGELSFRIVLYVM